MSLRWRRNTSSPSSPSCAVSTVAAAGQKGLEQVPEHLLVLHDQDGFAPGRNPNAVFHHADHRRIEGVADREVEMERRPLTRAAFDVEYP